MSKIWTCCGPIQKVELKCCNCVGQHSAAYGGCEKQKEAREVQKFKIIHQVSYAEALKKVHDNDRNSQRPTYPPEQNRRSENAETSDKGRGNDRRHGREQTQQASINTIPEVNEYKAKISAETMLVNKNSFVAFICSKVNVTVQHTRKSDRIKSVVEAAKNYLGIIVKY